MIDHVLEENGRSVELTEVAADDLESSFTIFLCEDCSRPTRYVYHTTSEWDERCEAQGSDPVTRALEQVNG